MVHRCCFIESLNLRQSLSLTKSELTGSSTNTSTCNRVINGMILLVGEHVSISYDVSVHHDHWLDVVGFRGVSRVSKAFE